MIILLTTGKQYDTSQTEPAGRLLKYISSLKSRKKYDELDNIKKQIEAGINISDIEIAIYIKAGGKKDLKNNYNNIKLEPTLPTLPPIQALPTPVTLPFLPYAPNMTDKPLLSPTITTDIKITEKIAAPLQLPIPDVKIAAPVPEAKTDVKTITTIPAMPTDLTATGLPSLTTQFNQKIVAPPPPNLPYATITIPPLVPEDPINSQLIANSNEIEEEGETSFQSLYAYLLADMTKYTNDINILIIYSSLVVNLFVHAATYTPAKGHGKAPQREFNHKTQLQYFRSQGDHANAKLFRELIKDKSGKCKSRLPLNSGFVKLISPPDFPDKFCTEIKKMDLETGLPKKGVKIDSFVINKIAHAGARKNNFGTLARGMKIAVTDLQGEKARIELEKKLKCVLPPTHNITKIDSAVLSARIQDLLTRFKKVQPRVLPTIMTSDKLSGELLGYRVDRVTSLQEKIKNEKFKHIDIDDSHKDITCLMIRLYPHCNKNDDSYKEGVTNVLLSFFGALINYHIKRRGLQLRAERRQSFGFLRPTLTDAGNLMIRLSLGLEPKIFDEIVLQSLKDLDGVLEKFKFDDPTHHSVKNVFEHMPAKPKKQTTENNKPKKNRKSDTYIRNVVRKDNRTLTTFQQAENYLTHAASTHENTAPEKAMELFLNDYIRNNKTIHPTEVAAKEKSPIQPCSSKIINLLKNLLDYTLRFISDLEYLAANDPSQPFVHCYWHSLLKLYNNYNEAQILLDNLERTEATEFYRRATLLSENMLEYLISLDALKQIRCRVQGKPIDSLAILKITEITYFAKALTVPLSQVDMFFTDSGQQAITTALLVLSVMLHGPAADGISYAQDIHLFGKSYFEVAAFLDDVKKEDGIHQMYSLEKAKIVFADISQLNLLDINKCLAMKALVIDITHHPLADSPLLKQRIAAVHAKGGWVVLVESALKHEELGLDKYQAGKITTLAPPNQSLPTAAKDQFNAVSTVAMHPVVASYFQMVNEICRDKLPAQEKDVRDTVSANALPTNGLFNSGQPMNKPTQTLPLPEIHKAPCMGPTPLG